jgi:hypothetical protein
MAVTQSRDATKTRTEKGISLARGPALIVGTILLAAGLYFLYRQHNFPKLSNFPNGKARVDGKVFGVFGANGWTGMLIAVAGGLLLFGAAQHLLAKTISLIVGVALAAAVVIAVASGDVLGLAAANGWTEFAWGVVAAILLLNTVIPRRRFKRGPLRPRQQQSRAPSTACGLSALRLRNMLADRTFQLLTQTTTQPTYHNPVSVKLDFGSFELVS